MTQADAHGHEYTRDGGVKGKERLTIAGVAKMWPTPDTMCGLTFKSQKTMTRQANTVRRGRTQASNLRDQVAIEEGIRFWPTPQSRDYRTGEGHRWQTLEKRSRNLNDAIAYEEGHRMWPTPTKSAYKGSGVTAIRKDGKDRKNDRLDYAVNCVERKFWPTPSANEDAAGTPNGKMQKMLGNHPDIRITNKGTLNPPWVEWLMGYPRNWTGEGETTAHDGFDNEPLDIPRVAIGVPDRVNRLKGLGNAVVSQIPEIIGRAIMEIEDGEA